MTIKNKLNNYRLILKKNKKNLNFGKRDTNRYYNKYLCKEIMKFLCIFIIFFK